MTDREPSALGLSVVLYTGALLVALSITLALLVPASQHLLIILLRAPGRFLFSSFHLAAIYVPAVLTAGGALLLSSRFRPIQIWLLLFSVVPFFTAAILIRILAQASVDSSPVTLFLVEAFGRFGSISILTLAVFLEIFSMWYSLKRKPRPITGGMKRINALLLSDYKVESEGEWQAVATSGSKDVTPRSLVDLPDPGEPAPAPEPAIDVEHEPAAEEAQAEEAQAEDEASADEEPPLEIFFSRGEIRRAAAPGDEPSDAHEPAPEALEPPVDDDEPPESWDEWKDDSWEDGADEVEVDELEAEELDAAWERSEAQHAERRERREPVEAKRPAREETPRNPLDDAPVVPVPKSKRYDVPISGLLQEYSNGQYWQVDDKTREAAETLRVTLEEFGIEAEVTGIRKGPVITMFEILPAPGVKLSKIVNLSDNIALRLAASSVRIVAPIPGKHAVGIEIPNKERSIVGFAELVQEEAFQAPRMEVPIALGKDIPGDAEIVDLTRMPHVLIAGATGSGKSVCVNSIICSILYKRAPHEVKLVLIDPKIVELKFYNDIPHLLTPVITDPKRAFQALQWCIYEMERRYSLLDALQVRDIQSYNKKIKSKRLATEPLPYIVVVVDEFADLMATSGKELEGTLARLAAMSRAVGIHLVLATQRPSTDVITGLIKANIPSRIAFMVASKVDSRIILDTMGAEKLLGRGDMLFTSAWDPFPTRMQGAFLSEDEVERVVTYVKQLGEPEYIDDEIFVEEDDEDYLQGELEDPLMEKAIEIVTSAGKASASYLQRRLKIGYNRAARIVEEMERMGIVGPQQGSKPREIIGSGDRL